MTILNLPAFDFKTKVVEGKRFIFDSIRKKYLLLTPEEWVRQHFVKYLVVVKKYPPQLIALELPFDLNSTGKRSDIVVYNSSGKALVLVECKSTVVAINQKVFDQVAGYNLKLHASVIIVTNGMEHFCCKPDYDNRKWQFLEEIPDYQALLSIGIETLQ